jgi:hypothetical protein
MHVFLIAIRKGNVKCVFLKEFKPSILDFTKVNDMFGECRKFIAMDDLYFQTHLKVISNALVCCYLEHTCILLQLMNGTTDILSRWSTSNNK